MQKPAECLQNVCWISEKRFLDLQKACKLSSTSLHIVRILSDKRQNFCKKICWVSAKSLHISDKRTAYACVKTDLLCKNQTLKSHHRSTEIISLLHHKKIISPSIFAFECCWKKSLHYDHRGWAPQQALMHHASNPKFNAKILPIVLPLWATAEGRWKLADICCYWCAAAESCCLSLPLRAAEWMLRTTTKLPVLRGQYQNWNPADEQIAWPIWRTMKRFRT